MSRTTARDRKSGEMQNSTADGHMSRQRMTNMKGAWVQINTTMVPCIKSGSSRLLSLSVLRNAANLLRNHQIPYQRATEQQSYLLNSSCKVAGVDFRFAKHTKLVTLDDLLSVYSTGEVGLYVKELTTSNPFEHDGNQQSLVEYKGYTAHAMYLQERLMQETFHHLQLMHFSHHQKSSVSSVNDYAMSVSLQRIFSPQMVSGGVTGMQELKPVNIQPKQFRGKTISCLVDYAQEFALLEVLSRVYFGERSLECLLSVLSDLNIPTRELTLREELAFIAFYSLPTTRLHCKRVLNMALIEKHYLELKKALQIEPLGRPETIIPMGLQFNKEHRPFRPWVAEKSFSAE